MITVSVCCGKIPDIDSGEEGTNCYVCPGCGEPCDIMKVNGWGYGEKAGESES